MSFLKSKHNGWLSDGTRTPFTGGGGSGSSGPTQTTAYNTNIPEYARPYVENMLQSAQTQVYNDDMTGFRPYQPYSSDVNNYFAGFSPLQQSAQQAAYNMQVPGQYGAATGLAGVSGLGALGVSEQAAGAGQQYAYGATDPRTTQAYMSPYMQNVVDFQKQSALRDYQVAQPMRQAQAVGAGAFGGSRQAIVDSEAQRNLNSQLQGITATGTQKAFEDAQRQQQFGAQLGLQGYNTALQGLGQAGQAASTLGQLGTAQLGAEQSIANLQNTMGGQQQALEQRKIDQAIQDYAIQQQYPMMQLGFMSNMLRGLPMQAQTTQLYQAQPSVLQQGAGLIGAGASLFGGKAEGGVIKMAEGGIAGYKYGGAIPEAKLAGMADNLSVPQLVERLKDPALTQGEREVFQEALTAKQNTAARSSGIAAAGGGMFDTMGYAGGGILAFAEGDVVEDKERSAFQQDLIDTFGYSGAREGRPEVPEYMKKIGAYFTKPREKTTLTPAQLDAIAAKQGVFAEGSPALSEGMPVPAPTAKAAPAGPSAGATGSKGSSGAGSDASGIGGILAGLRKEGPKGELGADYLDKLKALETGADNRLSKADRIAMAKGFLKFGSTAAPGGIGQAAVAGLGEYTEGYSKALESDEKFRMENAKLQSDIQNLRRAEERGDVKLAAELQEKIADRANRLQTAQISASSANSARAQDAAYVKQLMAQGMSLEQALQAVKGAGKAESNDIARTKAALAQINEELLLLKKDDPRRAALMAQRDQITRALASGGSMQTAGGTGNLVQNKDGSFNYVPK
jgi:hypothetical protein